MVPPIHPTHVGLQAGQGYNPAWPLEQNIDCLGAEGGVGKGEEIADQSVGPGSGLSERINSWVGSSQRWWDVDIIKGSFRVGTGSPSVWMEEEMGVDLGEGIWVDEHLSVPDASSPFVLVAVAVESEFESKLILSTFRFTAWWRQVKSIGGKNVS